MNNNLYIVDSFTSVPFKGNPAGVNLVESFPDSQRMQNIASELNLSETAFVSPIAGIDELAIRYYSPKMEIPLCGHATLASAKVIFDTRNTEVVQFRTGEDRLLIVEQQNEQIQMSFPIYDLEPANVPADMLKALGVDHAIFAGFNSETKVLMLEIESCDQLVNLKPDYTRLLESHDSIHGLSVTARANDEFDFYSRFFWPWSGGNEDPVTGVAHTFLAKYWSEKLGKSVMNSFQASARSGMLEVEITNDSKLLIRGQAQVFMEGILRV